MKQIIRFFTHPPKWVAIGPFQLVLTVVAIIQGLAIMGSAGHSDGILGATYPLPMVLFWGACLFLGGILATVGRIKEWWRAEAGGLGLVAVTLLWFVVTALALHPGMWAANLENIGLIYACSVRIRVLKLAYLAVKEFRGRRNVQ